MQTKYRKENMINLKLKEDSIRTPIDIKHYGCYSSDYDFGEYYKPYRDWVEKTHSIKWEDYTPGMFNHDTEMLQNFCDQNNYSIDCHYDEDTDNIYLIKIEVTK